VAHPDCLQSYQLWRVVPQRVCSEFFERRSSRHAQGSNDTRPQAPRLAALQVALDRAHERVRELERRRVTAFGIFAPWLPNVSSWPTAAVPHLRRKLPLEMRVFTRTAAYGFVANSHFRKSRPSAAVENEAIGVNLAR